MGRYYKKTIDGKRFGNLIVNRATSKRKNGCIMWECLCNCGKITLVTTRDLNSGNTKSCGCMKNAHFIGDKNPKYSHGQTGTRLYAIWKTMKRRCDSENTIQFHNYGGRGIRVCDEWKRFQPFYDWSMKNGYNKNLTIDRIDHDLGYFPQNCQWITLKENIRKSPSVKLTMRKAEAIRFLKTNYSVTNRKLGEIYGVHKDTIGSVIRKEIWT